MKKNYIFMGILLSLFSNSLVFTQGSNNTVYGDFAFSSNTTGSFNTANGYAALAGNTTGNFNVALGYQALISNISGHLNTALGSNALYSNVIGESNTAIGRGVLRKNTTGSYNTANGAGTLYSNTTGSNNTAIGQEALYFNTTGRNNTAIGKSALSQNHKAENNIAIGYNAQVDVPGWNHQVRIGNDQIYYAGIQVAWTVTSDRRWKDRIRELPYGLDMVMRLRPVDYVRKNNERKKREVGFIAQEVEQVMTQLGYKDQGFLTKNDKGYMSLRYNDFIPVLTKAVQELKAENDDLKERLKLMNAHLLERLEALEQNADLAQKDDDQENFFKVSKK